MRPEKNASEIYGVGTHVRREVRALTRKLMDFVEHKGRSSGTINRALSNAQYTQ